MYECTAGEKNCYHNCFNCTMLDIGGFGGQSRPSAEVIGTGLAACKVNKSQL